MRGSKKETLFFAGGAVLGAVVVNMLRPKQPDGSLAPISRWKSLLFTAGGGVAGLFLANKSLK